MSKHTIKQWHRERFTLTTDPDQIDKRAAVELLQQQTYWAKDFSASTLETAIEHSLCYGLHENDRQIGFARLVTDYAVFAYLEDVIIDQQYRGAGLGKWMMQCIMAHIEALGINKTMLATADAHGLYEQYGFRALKQPELMMEYYRGGVVPEY